MLTDRSMIQTAAKLNRLVDTLKEKIFVPVGKTEPLGMYETKQPLHEIPDASLFHHEGEKWGGEGVYAWFRMKYTVPEELDGKELFFYPHTTFFEATLWVNGKIHSNYAAKFVEGSHGNHWCNRITAAAKAGETLNLAMECYAYHVVPGTQPVTRKKPTTFVYSVSENDICVRDDELMEFMFDLEILLKLRESLPGDSFRRAELENALYKAHLSLYYDPDTCSDEQFRAGIKAARPILKQQLAEKNGETAPYIGLIGHSHMDTAWLWPLTETEKKCARTYANTLNLMDEYPEYKFIQSSAYHSEMLRRDYPELFERIRKAVAAGRYEPNGGVWIECDCNLTGGEYMVRQFLWGQRFTRKYFGYTADCFWLPDTFGYSFAIPQIMKGCGVNYFLTTKLSWNDTNSFPLTSFKWQGMDGTQVFTHFNQTHIGPDPLTYREMTSQNAMKEKRVTDMRLFSFGKGDGGGGPEFEMLEHARRLNDLSGTARSSYTTVSDFMKKLESTAVDPSVYAGELYLELHRGTLTNQHEIKRNNRLCEMALHNLEFATVMNAVRSGIAADGAEIVPMMETLLVHQFHDILPGTCIRPVHEETKKSIGETISKADALTHRILNSDGDGVVLYNMMSADRSDTIYLKGTYQGIKDADTQSFKGIDGGDYTAVHGITLPSLGSRKLVLAEKKAQVSPFVVEENRIETPFALITFSENGEMASFIDRRNNRELVKGLPFNTFLIAEDIPAAWDNWDVDADMEEKLAPTGKLISREVISNGSVELRIRFRRRLTEKSSLTQDIVFDAATPLVSFETMIDWQDDHRFLKTAFDTALITEGVRSEIQFGNILRSNHRSTSVDKARFEICNHKYSDLSEANYGFAVLNDCKYALSVNEGSVRLSLHKGGCLPDESGDKGQHFCRYAILPHMGGFSAQNVVEPAYAFNYRPVEVTGGIEAESLCTCDDANVIIETVKPCEDAQRAYILRLYEAVGGYSSAHLTFSHEVKAMYDCNMLEEELEKLLPDDAIVFTPFKIKTIKVEY